MQLIHFWPLLHKMGTCKNKIPSCKEINRLALHHTGAEFSGRKTASTSLAGGNSLSNDVVLSYLQFRALFTTHIAFKLLLTNESDILRLTSCLTTWLIDLGAFLLPPPSMLFVVSSPVLLVLTVPLQHPLLSISVQSSPNQILLSHPLHQFYWWEIMLRSLQMS